MPKVFILSAKMKDSLTAMSQISYINTQKKNTQAKFKPKVYIWPHQSLERQF